MDYKNKETVFLLLIAFMLGSILGYSYNIIQEKAAPALPTGRFIPVSQISGPPVPPSIESSVTIKVPAVDSNGNGAIMNVTVQKRGGYGETLIDIDNLVFWSDTQQSIRAAKSVAEKLTGFDTSKLNLVYIVDSDANVVGGPSAGAALTAATIAALEERPINNSVIITGAVRPDGRIGAVGGIMEKAKAAKTAGAEILLVPPGQGSEVIQEPYEACYNINRYSYCMTRYKETIVDISTAAGIEVREVSTVADAMKYFFGQ